MRKLIYTRVALNTEDDDADSEIRKLQGKDSEVDVWGKVTFLLDEVVGVMEYHPTADSGPDAEQCNVMFKNGKTWGIQMPYEELKALLREYHGEDQTPAPMDLGIAIKTLAQALNNDPELYSGWRANLAMAFYDERKKSPSSTKAAEIANQAAGNFLDNLIKSVE